MLADAKYRWKDHKNLANPHINGEEVDTFLYSIKNHELVNCALFLVLGDAKIPYKCQPINYEIIPREGRPHLPVAWVITRNQRTVHTAVLALAEMQKQCSAIFENKHVTGKAQDVFKMYQEDMNKDSDDQQAKKMKCTLQFRLGSYQHPFHACLAVSYAESMGQNPKVNGQFPKGKDGKELKRNWKMDYQFDRYKESAQILKKILYNELETDAVEVS
jgi:hypothetical protein